MYIITEYYLKFKKDERTKVLAIFFLRSRDNGLAYLRNLYVTCYLLRITSAFEFKTFYTNLSEGCLIKREKLNE